MPENLSQAPEEKSNLHPRNPHRFPYDFDQLILANQALEAYVIINKYHNKTIDFSDATAVKMLNKALLKQFYGLSYWDIPQNFLCPPIPGRADYIHYMADLLASSNNGVIPTGNSIAALDIGIGANCIYPIIGQKEYGWNFIGSDINAQSIVSANKIISSNSGLTNLIECRFQANSNNIFKGIIKENETYDFSLCNPPFHESAEAAASGTKRKWRNLGYKKTKNATLNFGGQHAELWCDGGEEEFIKKMVSESLQFSKSCFWFSTLVSKSSSLPAIYYALKKVGVLDVKTINMTQGNKLSRIVAWTFLDKQEQDLWRVKRWGK